MLQRSRGEKIFNIVVTLGSTQYWKLTLCSSLKCRNVHAYSPRYSSKKSTACFVRLFSFFLPLALKLRKCTKAISYACIPKGNCVSMSEKAHILFKEVTTTRTTTTAETFQKKGGKKFLFFSGAYHQNKVGKYLAIMLQCSMGTHNKVAIQTR